VYFGRKKGKERRGRKREARRDFINMQELRLRSLKYLFFLILVSLSF
jgi:hypothetical protein